MAYANHTMDNAITPVSTDIFKDQTVYLCTLVVVSNVTTAVIEMVLVVLPVI